MPRKPDRFIVLGNHRLSSFVRKTHDEWRGFCVRCRFKVKGCDARAVEEALDRHVCDPAKDPDPWLLGKD